MCVTINILTEVLKLLIIFVGVRNMPLKHSVNNYLSCCILANCLYYVYCFSDLPLGISGRKVNDAMLPCSLILGGVFGHWINFIDCSDFIPSKSIAVFIVNDSQHTIVALFSKNPRILKLKFLFKEVTLKYHSCLISTRIQDI